ncbi:uncharacterized protein LOC115209734 [Argonauta hians]
MNANPSAASNSGSSSAAAAAATAAAAAAHFGYSLEYTTEAGDMTFYFNETLNETSNETITDLSSGIFVKTPLPLWLTIILGFMAGICSLVTVLGNAMVLFSFAIERAIRQPTNYFIASLAVSDLLIGSFSMPFFTSYLLLGYWPMGPWLCDLWLSLDWTVCLASQYTVFLITMDRFCSVKLPAKYRNWRTERKVIIMIAVIWVLPISIFFTCIIGWQFFVGQRTVKERECEVQFMSDPVFLLLLTIGYYWSTLIVMCGLYTGIYRVALNLQRKSEAKHKKISAAMEMATDQTQQGNSLRTTHIDKTEVCKDLKSGKTICMTTTSFSSKRNSEKEDERSSSPAFASDDENSSQSPKPSKKPSPKDLPQLLCDIGKVQAGLIEDAPISTTKSHAKANGSKKSKGNLKFSTKLSQKAKNHIAENLNNRSMSNACANTVKALYEPTEVKSAQKSPRSASLVDKSNSEVPLLGNETKTTAFDDGITENESILKNVEGEVQEHVSENGEHEEDLIDCSIPHLEAELSENAKLLPVVFSDETYTDENNVFSLDQCQPANNESQNSPVWKRRSLVKYSASSPAIDLTASSSVVAEASYSSYEEDCGESGEAEEEMTSLLQQCPSQASERTTPATPITPPLPPLPPLPPPISASTSSLTSPLPPPPPPVILSETMTDETETDIINRVAIILPMPGEQIPILNSNSSDLSSHCLDNPQPYIKTNYEEQSQNYGNSVTKDTILKNDENLNQRQNQDQQQQEQMLQDQEKNHQTKLPLETQNLNPLQQQNSYQQVERSSQLQQYDHQDTPQIQEDLKEQKQHITNNQNDDIPCVAPKRTLKYSSPFQAIVKNMGKQKVRRRSKKEKTKSKSENRARKALRTITFILGAFVLCWTPYHLMVAIIGMGGGNDEVGMTMYKITYWLCYLNSPINPFCYAFANVQFKRTFLRILRFDWHRT